jgi:hypothetical protein
LMAGVDWMTVGVLYHVRRSVSVMDEEQVPVSALSEDEMRLEPLAATRSGGLVMPGM